MEFHLCSSHAKNASPSIVEQLWLTYSAPSFNNLDKLRKGMHNAIQVQRAIHWQGTIAITKNGFIRCGWKFRWVNVEDAVDVKWLGYPQAFNFCY